MELKQINVYRMVHIKNVSHILKNGITHKDSLNANPSYISIGDLSLIDTRNSKNVIVNNGNYLAIDSVSIMLGDFIPFYFGVKMPMLFVMQSGGNFVKSATSPKDIVYLACSLDKIMQSDLVCYFSDGHATDNFSTFYDKSQINEIPKLIDWSSIKAPFWGGQENLNIKRKKQAEFLIQNYVPPDFLIGFGCYNEEAKQQLINEGIDEEIIKIIPNAYY